LLLPEPYFAGDFFGEKLLFEGFKVLFVLMTVMLIIKMSHMSITIYKVSQTISGKRGQNPLLGPILGAAGTRNRQENKEIWPIPQILLA
jgi:hypothetical protein